MPVIIFALMVALVLVASYYNLRLGIGLLALFVVAGLVLVLASGLNIFGGHQALEIESADIEFSDANHAYAGTYQIEARITNNNEEGSIKTAHVTVQALDCPADDSPVDDCLVIAESASRFDVDIPPLQARDVRFQAAAGDIDPRGTLNWQLDISRLDSH